MNVVVLTPIALEFKAASSGLTAPTTVQQDGYAYLEGNFKGLYHQYRIILCETGSRNTAVALAAEKAIKRYNPALVILTGIAGGLKDVKIGDVVVGIKAYGYEAGKETADGLASRPHVLPFSKDLIAAAQAVSRQDNWRQRCPDKAPDATVYFGPIASGDKVIASTDSDSYRNIKQHYNDALALEMESIGFANALEPYRQVHGINIRGISDLLDHKSASDGRPQQIAAERAAAFVYELLFQLDCSTFIQLNMDTKTLVKEIFGALFSSEAIKAIGSDFKDAANGSIRELWVKLRPLFIEEVAELQKDPTDVMAQTELISKMKATVDANETLKQELIQLLEESKKQAPGAGVNIINSKNVVSGSNINVTGDLQIGDRTNNTISYSGIVSLGGQINITGENIAGRDMNINK